MQATLKARFLALCLLACAARAFAASTPAILYVNSYHPGYSWSDALQASLLGVLRDSLGETDSIHAEYLDAKRYGPGLGGELGQILEKAWEKKYGGVRFSLLLVSDQDGYDFMRRVRARLFPGVPLVFVGVEEPSPLDPATTGILSTTNLEANIDLIRQVMPGTRRIWVITDPSLTGRLNQAHMAALAKHLVPQLELRFFHNGEGIDEDSLLDQVATIPVSEPLFFLDYAVDASGRSVPVLPFLKRLTSRSRAPVFSHVDLYRQGGVAGGYMKSGELQGRQLALLGLDVLRGRVHSDVSPRPEQGRPHVDKSKLRSLGIHVQNLPEGVGLYSDLKDLWDRFAPYMVLLSVFLILQSLTIAWLVLLYRRQRHLREVAADEERLFRTVFELAPFPCVLNRLDGTYMNVNQAFLENMGHPREEVIGKTALQLLEAENGDAEDLELYRKDAQKRMRALREKGVLLNEPLRFGKHDNRERYYSSRLIDYKNTPCVLTIILDLTELHQTRTRLRQSEEKFQRIVESMPMAVGVANAQGQIIYVNRAFNLLFGFTVDEIPDMETWTLNAYPDKAYREQSLAQWKADIEAAGKDSSHISPVHTYSIVDKIGHSLEIDITFTLVEGDIYAMFDDVTFQKKAERELHEGIRRAKAQRVALAQLTLGPEGASLHLEELYKTTAQVVSQALQVARASVWMMDAEGKLLVCQALYDAQSQSLESGTVLDPATFPDYFQALKGNNRIFVEDAQSDPRSAELAENYLKPLHIASMLDAAILVEGRLVGVLCCEHVGTPRHWHSDEESFIGHISAFLSQQLINQERHQSMRLAMLKSQELEQLIYVASHDLRTPLVNLDGFGRELAEAVESLDQVLGEEPVDNQVSLRLRALMPEMGVALTRIRQSTRRMGDLLSGLLAVARLGREELHIRDLDVEALVRRLLRDLEPRLHEAQASLSIGSLPSCRADERQTVQLWLGLLDNAIKFRSPKRKLCLEIGGSRRGNECVYWVADNGIGIAKEYQSKVFELFHKLAPDAAPGEGVGLAMVRQIVARMGGRVWVESEPDTGSRFYVELPASRAGRAA